MAGDRVLTVRLAGDPSGAVGAMGTVQSKAVGLGKQMLKFGAILGGINLGANLISDIKDVGMSYTRSMNEMEAVTGSTQKVMDQVGDKAKELGADLSLPATSAADATGAMLALVKGGLSVEEAMDAAKGSIQLAAAAQIDGARAAEIQAGTMAQFNLEAEDAADVADALANVANSATGSIDDVANAMEYAGGQASSLGMSVDETATTIGTLAKESITGQKAGRSLRMMMTRMANPVGKAAEGFEKLGIQAFNASGEFKGMRYVTKRLARAKENLTQEEFNQASAMAFSSEQMQAVNALANGGTEVFDEMAGAVGRQGAAAKLAKSRNKGLGGALDGLESQMEDLYLMIYESASPVLEDFVDLLADGLQKFNDLMDGGADVEGFADALNSLDGSALGDALVDAIETALDKIGSMAGDLYDAVKRLIEKVDWVGLGIEAGKAAIPLAVGLVTGIINSLTDLETWKSLGQHWQDILWAVLAIAFAPAKLVGKLGQLLSKIPLVGRFLSWFVTSINKIGSKIKKKAKELMKDFWGGFKRGFDGGKKSIWSRFKQWGKEMIATIKQKGKEWAQKLSQKASDMADRFGNFLARKGPAQARNALIKIRDKIFNFFRGAGSWLKDKGGNIIDGLVRGLGSKMGSIWQGILSVKNSVTGFFRSAGTWLWNAGSSIIGGLIDGIKAKAREIPGAVGGALSKARDYLPFSPAKKGPFSGKGWTLYSGRSISEALAKGVTERAGKVSRAAAGLAKAAQVKVKDIASPETSVRGSLRPSGALAGHSGRREFLSRQNGSGGVTVNLRVEGNIVGERDFVKRVIPTVRNEFIKIGKRNGGKIFE